MKKKQKIQLSLSFNFVDSARHADKFQRDDDRENDREMTRKMTKERKESNIKR
jgi:hypothetical protein